MQEDQTEIGYNDTGHFKMHQQLMFQDMIAHIFHDEGVKRSKFPIKSSTGGGSQKEIRCRLSNIYRERNHWRQSTCHSEPTMLL